MSLLTHLEEQAEYLLSELKRLAASHNSAYGDHDDRLKAIIETLENHVDDNAPAEDPAPVVVDTPIDSVAEAQEVTDGTPAEPDTTPAAPVVDTQVTEAN